MHGQSVEITALLVVSALFVIAVALGGANAIHP